MNAARLPAMLLTAALVCPIFAADPAPAAKNVDFERHVMGLLGKVGCNSGSCHGSFQGRGGMRLSLFGYDPDMDYHALTRDNQGRRVNPADPDSSLVLLKATGAVEHGGLRRFAKGSWQYNLLRDWIAAGMPRGKDSGKIKSVAVTPSEVSVKKVGETTKLKVTATFADGSTEDITSLCDYRANDDIIASVSPRGEVESRQAGDTAVIVSYRGELIPVRVMVPMTPPPGFRYPDLTATNYIDREVYAKLKRLNIAPAERCDDLEFLRRVTLDVTGSLPTPEEIRSFVADKDAKKREKKIDELLASPRHAALWATKFCDITGNNTDRLENPQQFKPKLSQMWHDWFRVRLEKNVPYDEIIKGVLTATSRGEMTPEDWVKQDAKVREEGGKGFKTSYAERPTLDLFWRRQQQVPLEVWGEQTAVAFLGVRLECAQCHKHPFDRWTQEEYWAYANIFAPVNLGVSPDGKKAIDDALAELRKANMGKPNNQLPQIREVFIGQARTKADPTTGRTPTPKAPGGPQITLERGKDPRAALFDWMRSPENPFFARSFVNRIWGHYFGIGIVHPVDDFSIANPASNDALLDALAKDFIAGKFDIRKVEKTILMSAVYQQSSTRNPTNRLDTRNYARSYVRPLMAEVVVDIINDALAISESFGNEAPAGARAIEIGSTRVVNPQLREAFRVFGRSPRTLACDCERALEPTVSQKLFLMADPGLQTKLVNTQTRVKKALEDKNRSDADVIEELFLATVSRFPTETEKQACLKYFEKYPAKTPACNDILWALLNTKEFIFNH